MTLKTHARLASVALLLAVAFPFGAVAQDTSSEAPVTETEKAAPAIEDDLSLGEEANPAGQLYVKEEIDDWALRCIKTPEGDERCQMYQLLVDENDVPVAEFTLFRLPAGGRAEAGATIIVPLETSLQEQLTVQVDSGAARKYPFAFCNPVGCYARVGFTGQDISAFKAGANATLTITPYLAPDQKVALTMSLKGFTAAFGKASVVAQ